MSQRQRIIKEFEELDDLLSRIDSALHQKQARQAIEKILDDIDLSSSTTLLIGYLRYTFVFQRELSNWNKWRDKIACELKRRKLDNKKLLRGLYE